MFLRGVKLMVVHIRVGTTLNQELRRYILLKTETLFTR